MHIILGFLGVVVTILVLLNRLSDAGIDIGWLNPFAWRRRRNWRKQYKGNPIFQLKQPLEVACLLCTAMAKIDGEISREDKNRLLELFQEQLGRDQKQASDLLMSSSYLLGDGEEALAKPEKIIESALDEFSEEQAKSVVSLLESILNNGIRSTDKAQTFLSKVNSTFASKFDRNSGW